MKHLIIIFALFVGNAFGKEVGLYCKSSELSQRDFVLENGEIQIKEPKKNIEIDRSKEKFLILNSQSKTIEEFFSWIGNKNLKMASISEKGTQTYEWNHMFNIQTFEDITFDKFINFPSTWDTAFFYTIDRESLKLELNFIQHLVILNIGYALGKETIETYKCEMADKKVFENRESILEEIKLKKEEQESKNKI